LLYTTHIPTGKHPRLRLGTGTILAIRGVPTGREVFSLPVFPVFGIGRSSRGGRRGAGSGGIEAVPVGRRCRSIEVLVPIRREDPAKETTTAMSARDHPGYIAELDDEIKANDRRGESHTHSLYPGWESV
jgi:hypothetical protein